MSSLRICLLSYMLSKRATGLSSYIADLTRRLLDDGHQVTVLATDCGYRGSTADELMPLDPRANLIVFPVRGGVNRRLYRSRALVKWFGNHVHEFDLLDIQGIWAVVNIEVAKIAQAAALPYIVTPHGMLTKWDWTKRFLLKKLLFKLGVSQMLKHASYVRYLSAGELGNTAIDLHTRSITIPNAVEPQAGLYTDDIRAQICQQFKLNPKNKIILFLGRVCHQKGAFELAQAFELLYKRRKDISLVIAGPMEQGAYSDRFKAFLENSQAKQEIYILGPIFGDIKYDLYQAADIFVTLSRNEGLSLAALEALSQGLPLLVTKDSNLPEVELFNAGKVVSCEAAIASEALDSLLGDSRKLNVMKENAKKLFSSRFSWSIVLPQIRDLYVAVAGRQ